MKRAMAAAAVLALVMLAMGCGNGSAKALATMDGGGKRQFQDHSSEFHLRAGDKVEVRYGVGPADSNPPVFVAVIQLVGVASQGDMLTVDQRVTGGIVTWRAPLDGDYSLMVTGRNALYEITASSQSGGVFGSGASEPLVILLGGLVWAGISAAVGYWCMTIYRRTAGSPRNGFLLGFLLTFFLSVIGMIIAVVISYARTGTRQHAAGTPPTIADSSPSTESPRQAQPVMSEESLSIATFGPTTAWAGKTISYENGRFTLEDYGAISAADVLTYDRQGHLNWAYEGLKAWVETLASMAVAPQVSTSEAGPHRAAVAHGRGVGTGKRIALVVVVIALAAGGVLAYRSYDRYSTKKHAQDAWLAYWNAAVRVRNKYVNDFNKVAGQSQKRLSARKHDTIADALRRAARDMAHVKPPRELTEAHATLVSAWRREARGMRKHANAAGKLGQKKIDLLDFPAAQARIDGITRELKACAACADRADAAWKKWTQAAKREAERLGYTVTET